MHSRGGRLGALAMALLITVGVATTVVTPAAAAGANVTITATPSTAGSRATVAYGAHATAAGTVREVRMQLPAGSGGRLTTINGTLRTVSPGVIKWVPGKAITARAGARFSIPLYGVTLPTTPGTFTLAASSISTTGRTIFSGTGSLVLRPAVAAAATVVASVPVPGAVTTLTYASTVSSSGTLSRLNLTLPAGAAGRLTTPTGILRTVSTGVISWTPPAPIAVTAGQSVRVTMGNVRLSVFGGRFSLPVTAVSTAGTVLSQASASLSLIAPPAQMAPPVASPVVAITDGCPRSWPSVSEENAQAGSTAWTIAPTATGSELSAYLTATSVACGEQTTLKVSSAGAVDVTAYRMGYYGGTGARAVWSQAAVPAVVQPAPVIDDQLGVSAQEWTPTLTIPITADWTPGTYLIKVSNDSLSTYVPLTVRDDTPTRHAIVLQQATATWQAYNWWGGHSFYTKGAGSGRLSSDRPYAEGQGSGQYLSLERGLVFWLEAAGYDVTYWTNEDLDRLGSQLPDHAATLILPGHDEYYSTNMRAAVQYGISNGVNVVSFGANAVYRKIGYSADRRTWEIDRSGGDLSSRWWGQGDAYSSQALLGAEYVCPVTAGNLATTGGWMFEGLAPGTQMPGFIAGEIDRVKTELYVHPGLEVAYTGVATCRSGTLESTVDVTRYTAPSGAKVFNGSTFAYGCFVGGVCPVNWQVSTVPDASRNAAGRIVANVLNWATGVPAPAGTARTGALPTIRHAKVALPLPHE